MSRKFLVYMPKILLLSISIVLSLVTIELISRVIIKEPLTSNDLIEKSSNSTISFQLKPNTKNTIRHPNGSPIEYLINEQGFRGKPYYQNAGMPILFFGDSVAFGWGIDEKYTYSTQVESLLRDKYKIESQSINLGVNGYNPYQYLELYKLKSNLYMPSMVILGFTLNDADPYWDLEFDDTRNGTRFKIRNTEVQDTYKGPFGGKFPFARILDNIHFYRTGIKPIILRIVNSQTTIGEYDIGYENNQKAFFDENFKNGWEVRKSAIVELMNLAEKNGQDFLLVIFPNATQLNLKSPNIPQNKIAQFAEENGIKYIDFLHIFRGSKMTKEDLYLDSVHPSVEGNTLIARHISEYIVKCVYNLKK